MSYTDFANAICHKTQKAAQAMVQARITANALTALLPLASVFGGIGIGDLTSKRVVCLCQRATPQLPWEGNWDADLEVHVIAPFADLASEDEFHELAGQMFAFFFQEPETVCARLSNEDVKYTAQFIVPTGAGWETIADKDKREVGFDSFQQFRITCSGSVIA